MRLHLVPLGLCAALLCIPAHAQISRIKYAEQCANEIEPLPAFNCMDSEPFGNEVHELEILVDGKPVKAHVEKCDNPIQLDLSGGQGQCVPFSRLVKLNSVKPTVLALAICRKYLDRGATAQQRATESTFDDIAVVQHDRLTGKTCFFQSTFEVPGDPDKKATHNGKKTVPQPTSDTDDAKKFWAEPPEVATIGCTKCHAADPFYWSPYVAPVLDTLNLNPNGRYNSNFANLFLAPTRTFRPKLSPITNNACVTCHRFGLGPQIDKDHVCNLFIRKYVDRGRAHATKPDEIWMPPQFARSRADWEREFKASREQIDRCCSDPDQFECRSDVADGHFPRTEAAEVLRATRSACSETACLGWLSLDNDRTTRALAASDATLFQLRENGMILRSTGSPCKGTFCDAGWTPLDRNPLTVAIAAGAGVLHQLRADGTIWRFTGTACKLACPGWVQLSDEAKTVAIAMGGIGLQRLDRDGSIWRFVGPACGKKGCTGWQQLDSNPDTIAIAAAPEAVYQLHKTGKTWRYTGKPCNADGCNGWQMVDNNPATIAIAAAGSQLYQLHDSGAVWRFNGTACSDDQCPGWRQLDSNPKTVAIAAAGNNLYEMHDDGAVWRFTGRPCDAEACNGWIRLDSNDRTSMIVAGGDRLYQLRQDGGTERRAELRNRPFGMAATQPR